MNKVIGVTKIAQILNEKQILTPTRYKQSKGINFKDNGRNTALWTESTVSKMLKNEVYIGNMVQGYNKKVSYKSKKMKTQPKSKWIVVENTHEPIITKEQFSKVQELFKSRTRTCKTTGEIHIFANKLVCKDCGKKLYKCRNDRNYIYFSCKGSKKLYGSCTPHSIGYENLKALVTEKIKEKILAFYNFEDVPDDLFVKKDNLSKLKNLEKKKDLLYKEMENINKAIKDLYLDRVKRLTPEDVFTDLNSSFLKDKESKQNEISKVENELSRMQEIELNAKLIEEQKSKIIESFKDFKELGFDVVNSFIDYIEIGEKNKTEKTQDVIIHWNF